MSSIPTSAAERLSNQITTHVAYECSHCLNSLVDTRLMQHFAQCHIVNLNTAGSWLMISVMDIHRCPEFWENPTASCICRLLERTASEISIGNVVAIDLVVVVPRNLHVRCMHDCGHTSNRCDIMFRRALLVMPADLT